MGGRQRLLSHPAGKLIHDDQDPVTPQKNRLNPERILQGNLFMNLLCRCEIAVGECLRIPVTVKRSWLGSVFIFAAFTGSAQNQPVITSAPTNQIVIVSATRF